MLMRDNERLRRAMGGVTGCSAAESNTMTKQFLRMNFRLWCINIQFGSLFATIRKLDEDVGNVCEESK